MKQPPSSQRKCYTMVLTAAFIILCILWYGASARPGLSASSTCMGGQWPLFNSANELSAYKPWAEYIRAVYGSLPLHGYPMCMGELWFMYSRGLIAAGIVPGRDMPAMLSTCPRDDGTVAGQHYVINSRLSPPNVTWSWHPAPQGYAAFEAKSWVEVLHKGGISDEHVGAWFLYAKGSGIWLDLGTTIAFDDHPDGWSHFGVSHLERDRRNEAMCANASAAGYDSIQFVRHTCKKMYRDCLNESIPTLTYFNVEIVSTKLQGIHACASANGTSPLLSTGWPQTAAETPGLYDVSGACTCDNNASAHLHCAELQLSIPQANAKSFDF